MRKPYFVFVLISGLLLTSLPASTHSLAGTNSAPPIIVYESDEHHLVLGLTSQEIKFQNVLLMDENMYTVVYIDRAGSLEVSEPNVPVFRQWILVPNGNDDEHVHLQVNPGEPTRTQTLEHPLAPLQYPTVDAEDAPMREFTIDQETYFQDELYPGRFAQLDPIQYMRGQNIARLSIYPYQYNPALQRLEVYNNMVVTIIFDNDVQPIPFNEQDEDFDATYRDLALNADEILAAEAEVDPGEIDKKGSYGWDYLIFTPPDFETAANTLAAWKQSKGFKTLVTKIPANWVHDDIKNALWYAYEAWDVKPKYVLLIGDAEFISPFYMTWHPYNDMKYKGNLDSQGFIGTDLYFSTLKSKNPFLPDEDLIPEVLLGRLSVEKAFEAIDRVNAIIKYEKSPPSANSFYDNVVMAAYFQDGGVAEVYNPNTGTSFTTTIAADGTEDKRFTQTSEDVAIFLQSPSVGKSIQRLYFGDFNRSKPSEYPKKWSDNKNKVLQDVVNFNGPTNNTVIGGAIPSSLNYPTFPWSANSASLSTAINNGAFLVTHRDHGGRLRWSNPAFDTDDVTFIANINKLPFVWSLNCQTGWFDNETDYQGKPGLADLTGADDESFSEAWERPFGSIISNDDYGALAVVAGTRVTYGSGNEPLTEGMIGAIWPKYLDPSSTNAPIYKLGAILNAGKLYMSAKMGDAPELTPQLEEFHLFGDPTVELRTQKSSSIQVVVEGLWPWGLHPHDYSVVVKKEDNSPLQRAKVTLKKKDESGSRSEMQGEIGGSGDFWTGTTDVEGQVTFPNLTTTGIGKYELVVTAPNFIPYENEINVEPGPAGGIVLDKEVYDCNSEIKITVADSNLTGPPQVQLVSSEGDQETLYLEEVAGGVFAESIYSIYGSPNSEDGVLQVADGVRFDAYYLDVDDGAGGWGIYYDQAVADCQAPDFAGLSDINLHGCYAHLTWAPASDPHGLVTYNVFRYDPGGPESPLLLELVGNTWMPGYVVDLCVLPAPYDFLVQAVDAPGNEDQNDVVLGVEANFYYLRLPIVRK